MKRIKTLRVLLTLMLAVVICIGSMTTVLAIAGPIEGTELAPAQAVISKKLEMADGTTTPAATFNFQFTKKEVDGDSSTAAQGTMPAITDKTVTFASTDTGTTTSGVKTVQKDTASLFAGIIWPHAGVYVYTVTEQSNTYTTSTGETMTYSGASYDISVYVANGASGLYVAAIGTTIELNDDGSTGSGGKTDPDAGTVTGTYRAMVFTNQYKKTGGTDPLVPADRTLAISKTVVGDYGDQTKYFTYSVTVTQSALATGTTTYKGYVVEEISGVDTVVTSSANGTIGGTDTNGAYIDFPSGTAVTVNLKHGQTIAFVDLEVGSSYVAVETVVADYTPKVTVIVNGGTPTDLNSVVSNELTTETRVIGENTNSAAFENTYKTITPTGIDLNDLPFILMLVVGAGALVVFVIVKSRKRDYTSMH